MPTVIVYWSPTRSPEEKEAVARDFLDTLVSKANANSEDVLIIFQNIENGDAFRADSLTETPSSNANE